MKTNNYLCVAFIAVFARLVAGTCSDASLGMESGKISSNKILASSEYSMNTPAKNGRLRYTTGQSWCAATQNIKEYLQLDLGKEHIICAVATQGNSKKDQWVKTYQLQTSTDGTAWTDYEEEGRVRVFVANSNPDTIVKHSLLKGVVAKLIRFLPKSHNGLVCLRAEVFGIEHQLAKSVNLAREKNTSQSTTRSAGGASSRAVDGDRSRNWFLNSCTHTVLDTDPWWRVDLGEVQPVSRVYVVNRQHAGQRLTNFELRIGNIDTDGDTLNPKCGDKYTIPTNKARNIYCNPAMEGRYVYIRIPGSGKILTLCEVEVYSDGDACTNRTIQTSNSTIFPNERWTASSYKTGNEPFEARLDGAGAWAPATNDAVDYLQIDLGSVYFICSVATQGNPNTNQWTKMYKIQMSVNKVDWEDYKNGYSEKVFLTGNVDKNSVLKYNFVGLNQARFVRFEPLAYNGGKALRVELFGVLQGIPAPPTDLRVTNIQSRSVTVQWRNPDENPALRSASSNKIHYSSGDTTKDITTQSLTTSYNVTGLAPYTEYKVKVLVHNNVGQGLWSAEESFITDSDVPEQAPTLTSVTTLTSQSLLVTWQKPDKINGALVGYKVLYRKKGQDSFITETLTGAATSHTLRYLEKWTEYEVKVQVHNIKGDSPASDVKSARTLDVQLPVYNVKGSSSANGETNARTTDNDTLNNSAILAVGGTILILLVVLIILVVYLMMKSRMKSRPSNAEPEEGRTSNEIQDNTSESDSRAFVELRPLNSPSYKRL